LVQGRAVGLEFSAPAEHLSIRPPQMQKGPDPARGPGDIAGFERCYFGFGGSEHAWAAASNLIS
jgi:hypothetical protein